VTLARVAALAGAIIGIAFCGPAPSVAHARDTETPPGAGQRWLPCEDWVMYHWLPYEEGRLHRLLGIGHGEVLRWLRDDHRHTLAGLAARRGREPQALATALVAPWRGRVSPAHHAELRRRALRTLTQGHLSQHILFHPFHTPAIAERARWVFGVSPLRFQRLRLKGHSPGSIGLEHGRSRDEVASRTMRILRGTAQAGVDAGATPSPQADRFLRRQRRRLRHWLDARIFKSGERGRPSPRVVEPASRRRCFLFGGWDHLSPALSLPHASDPGAVLLAVLERLQLLAGSFHGRSPVVPPRTDGRANARVRPSAVSRGAP
jgi:hypothetical protein